MLESLEAIRVSDKPGFINLLRDGCSVSESLSGMEFCGAIAAVGAFLRQHHADARRIGLVYPSGGFLIAPVMLGCIASGYTVVPMKVPKPRRDGDRASSVLVLADLDLVIIPTEFASQFRTYAIQQGLSLDLVMHENIMSLPASDLAPEYFPAPNDIAVLQFTSGSTGAAKGVELTLEMIKLNCLALANALDIRERSHLYNWMPFFHDFGLIFGLFLPVFLGCRIHIVDPMVFVQDPNTCFHGIEKNGITHTAFASFSLEHCVVQFNADALDQLDLSRLEKLLVGADMIKPSHAEEFIDVFSTYGFSTDSLVGGYGLAEGTLAVSVGEGGTVSQSISDPKWIRVLHDREVLDCGCPVDQVEVEIRIPNTNKLVSTEGDIGEILVRGPSVIGQYYNEIKGSSLVDVKGRKYFPTGDIGFLSGGSVFVCGRVKELLIINGENFSPGYIEDLCLSTANLRRASYQACAFVFRDQGMDHLGIVIEAPSEMRNNPDIIVDLQKAVLDATHLALVQVSFCRKGALPKTSSGKLMRQQVSQAQTELTSAKPSFIHNNTAHQSVVADDSLS